MTSKSLGELAYAIHTREIAPIGAQRHKSSTAADHEGPMPWDKLPLYIRKRWERFALQLAAEVQRIQVRKFADLLRSKGASAEDELTGARARLLHQEKQRQQMEKKS